MSEPAESAARPARRATPVLLLLVVIALAGVVRWRHLDVPLERDEGEYAHAASLLLEGVAPYERAYNMKLPGIYAAYAVLLTLLPDTPRGIHLGLLGLNALTCVLVFLLGRRLLDATAGLVAAACYALLSMGHPVQGLFANAEHFVLPFALGGLLLVLAGAEGTARPRHLALGCLLLGAGFVTKQHGAAFALLGGSWAVFAPRPRAPRDLVRRALLCGAALALPYAATCLALWLAGAFDNFWFWTVEYAQAYASQSGWKRALPALRRSGTPLLAAAPLVWALAGLGLAALLWSPPVRRRWPFWLAFAALSFLAVCPGFFFRPHYFVLLLPAAALLAGAGVRSLSGLAFLRARPWAPPLAAALLAGAALGHGTARQWVYLAKLTPYQVSRVTYGLNPFPESVLLAEYLRATTDPEDAIAVVGSEPQIYFYADRPAATAYMYTYALVEDQPFNERMQREFIRQIEESAPEILIFVRVQTSWLTHPAAPKLVFQWLERYTRNYELERLVVLRLQGPTVHAAPDIPELDPPPENALYVYRRKRP